MTQSYFFRSARQYEAQELCSVHGLVHQGAGGGGGGVGAAREKVAGGPHSYSRAIWYITSVETFKHIVTQFYMVLNVIPW